MSLIYDLSTNAKWTTLADGTHNITIIAKAAGYRDSNASGAVIITKQAPAATIEAGTIYLKKHLHLMLH